MTTVSWIAVGALGVLALVGVAFIADFGWLALRSLWYARTETVPEGPWIRKAVADAWSLTLYKWLPTPRIRVRGARPLLDDLFSGRTLKQIADWWNEYLNRRPGLIRQGARRVDTILLAATQQRIDPGNRQAFEQRAASLAPLGALAEGSLALAYCFARIFAAGSNSDWQETRQNVTVADLILNDERYDKFMPPSDLESVPSEGWWRELELRSLWNQDTIRAIRWAYRDQVRRWEAAEGREMGSGVGFASLDELGPLVQRFDDLLFEHGGRFLETETAKGAPHSASTEIIEEHDATVPGTNAWKVYYKVRRADGEEVAFEANCTDSAEAAARQTRDPESILYVIDRGRAAALHYAEQAHSPAQRGTVPIRLWVDRVSGQLRLDDRLRATVRDVRRFGTGGSPVS
jgi:hypothetical protein